MLGMRTDFNRRFNPVAMRIDAAHLGDHYVSKPFRKHDRLDELAKIGRIYLVAEGRADVEAIELDQHNLDMDARKRAAWPRQATNSRKSGGVPGPVEFELQFHPLTSSASTNNTIGP